MHLKLMCCNRWEWFREGIYSKGLNVGFEWRNECCFRGASRSFRLRSRRRNCWAGSLKTSRIRSSSSAGSFSASSGSASTRASSVALSTFSRSSRRSTSRKSLRSPPALLTFRASLNFLIFIIEFTAFWCDFERI